MSYLYSNTHEHLNKDVSFWILAAMLLIFPVFWDMTLLHRYSVPGFPGPLI